MGSSISWTIRFDVDPDRWEDFIALVPEMVESASNEPGTVSFEWWIDPDTNQAHNLERYEDEDAARAHSDNYTTKFAARLEPMVTIASFVVYGDPTPELADSMRSGGATIMTPLSGYRR